MHIEYDLESVGKFNYLKFEKRVFYIPNTRYDIYIEGHILKIDLGDNYKYVIANGLKCYQFLWYNAQDDTITTNIEADTVDGTPTNEWFCCTFPYDAKEFPLNEQHPRIVVPKRDYIELLNSFLAEKTTLDDSLKQLLIEHPDFFNAYWPIEKRDMNKIDWVKIDGELKAARENPECRPLLLDNDETIPEEYRRFPSWLHDFFVKTLGESHILTSGSGTERNERMERIKQQQLESLREIFEMGAPPAPAFKSYHEGVPDGMIPYISNSDLLDYKYNIRAIPISDYFGKDRVDKTENGEIIAHYDSLEELVDDGWMLD